MTEEQPSDGPIEPEPEDSDAIADDDESSAPSSARWTDEEFESHLSSELAKHPLSSEYPELFAEAPKLIGRWRRRYDGNPSLWKRLFREDRALKEFIESAPVIEAVRRLVEGSELNDGERFTIVDLCCGKGYLSMLLSELLPPEKVEKLVLVDKQWPMHNTTPGPHHISWTHIYGSLKEVEDRSVPRYYDTWPIRLNTSKVDLKKSKEISSLERRLFADGSGGPIILVAVHLCGTLSLKAVELFNDNPEARFLCLKPCCLPGMVHAKRDEVFTLGNHSFDSKLVCMAGKWKKNVWHGPPRTTTKAYFGRWAENLFLGIDDRDAAKVKRTIMVQHDGGYQNEFLFAERLPETKAVWDMLRKGEKTVEGE